MTNIGLLNSEVKLSLEKIVSHCFYGNRITDRICSLMSVKFVMPLSEKILHSKYAHLLPLLADKITEYMDSRDSATIYGLTPIGGNEYDDYIECFKDILDFNLELENKVKDSIKLSWETGDITTKVFLENFLLNLIPLTKDVMLLFDKAVAYGCDANGSNMQFDRDIHEFGVFE